MRDTSTVRVVVGVDGSAKGRDAVRVAARQAELYDGELRLVHAFNWLPAMRLHNGSATGRTARAVLDEAADLARETAPQVPVTVHLREGQPSVVLLREARFADLLVVSDRALADRTCLAATSDTVQLAARAACTVLIAKPAGDPAGPVIVGVEPSTVAGRLLTYGVAAAEALHAGMIVVRAAAAPQVAPGSPPQAQGRAFVERVSRLSTAAGVAALVRDVNGDPVKVLLAQSANGGLLIVGPRGMRPGRGMLGPVAQAMVHHATTPLLIVRSVFPVGARQRMNGLSMVGG